MHSPDLGNEATSDIDGYIRKRRMLKRAIPSFLSDPSFGIETAPVLVPKAKVHRCRCCFFHRLRANCTFRGVSCSKLCFPFEGSEHVLWTCLDLQPCGIHKAKIFHHARFPGIAFYELIALLGSSSLGWHSFDILFKLVQETDLALHKIISILTHEKFKGRS